MRLVRRAGVEPAQPEGGWVTATEARQCPADADHEWHRRGSNPCIHSLYRLRPLSSLSLGGLSCWFELRRFAGLRTVPFPKASPAGFEPAIFAVTGRRV